MKAILSLFAFALFTFLFVPTVLAAPLTYGSGVYTNICGSGSAANKHACTGGCNPTTGTCSSTNPYVVSYTCNGRVSECRDNESGFTWSQSLAGTACGKTVQIDVFAKNCRTTSTWGCNDNDLKDYLVWYSGDCNGPTATPTPKSPTNKSSCDQLRIVSGANAFAPATVKFKAVGKDDSGAIQSYRFHFGDGKKEETTNPEISHKYESSGTFSTRVDIKDSQGAWVTSASCRAKVTIIGTPLETQKSACSDLDIESGNNTGAPATVRFRINGFDNKKGIKKYKMEFGNGVTKESDTATFEQIYEQPGTYTAKAYIQDSKDVWKGGDSDCTQSVYVTTKPITTQPKTGTPTTYTLIALGAGVMASMLYFLKLRLS